MAFMEKQVTGKQTWLKIDGTHGITYVPIGDLNQNRAEFLLLDSERQLATVQMFYEGKPESVELVKGFGARLSAPGYLDCTEWTVFDTEAEAEAYLDEEYGDDDEEDEEDSPSEPQEDDITTTDHRQFYQYGKLVLIVGEDDDYKLRLTEYMEREQFWPNCWFISDHGNAHLIEF